MGTDLIIDSDARVLGPYWVCTDCIMFLANGDLPADDSGAASAIVAGCEREDPYRWVCGGTCEEHAPTEENPRAWEACSEAGCDEMDFSWRTCDCCGSKLGGSRHKASLIKVG